MFLRSVRPVLTNALAAELVGALAAVPGAVLLLGAHLRLFSNPLVTILPTMDVADYTEADFSGYAAASITTWIGPIQLPGFQWALHAEGDFLAGSPVTVPNVCYGYYLTNTAGDTVYVAEVFKDPVTLAPITANFANPGDYASVDCILPLPANLNAQFT